MVEGDQAHEEQDRAARPVRAIEIVAVPALSVALYVAAENASVGIENGADVPSFAMNASGTMLAPPSLPA